MDGNGKKINDILSSEIKDSFKMTLSDEFDKKVKEEINKKIIQKRLIRQYFLVISFLILFLLCIIFLFYINTAHGLLNINDTQNIASIWRYKYMSIIIISLSLAFAIDKIYKLKIM